MYFRWAKAINVASNLMGLLPSGGGPQGWRRRRWLKVVRGGHQTERWCWTPCRYEGSRREGEEEGGEGEDTKQHNLKASYWICAASCYISSSGIKSRNISPAPLLRLCALGTTLCTDGGQAAPGSMATKLCCASNVLCRCVNKHQWLGYTYRPP